MKSFQLGFATLALTSLLATQVTAHGHMQVPKGRTSRSFGDPEDTAACDSDKPGTVTTYKAGEAIDVVWTRNNHIGGFIRYAIAPKNAVSKAAFDANVFFYTCRESDCSLKQCKHKFCGDDAGSKADSITCRTKITLPDYLAQGDYVLQWTWHSAGSSFGNKGWSTGNYKTCADIKLTTAGTGAKPTCPTFVGGDRATKMEKDMDDAKRTKQCLYFDDNGVGKSLVKYSETEGFKRYMFGIPKVMEKCSGNAGNAGNASTPVPSGNATTTPAVTTPDLGPGPAPVPSSTKKTPKPTSGKPSSKTPKPTTDKPSGKTPKPATSSPAPATTDASDAQDESGKESDPDAPGTVAPWKQVAPAAGKSD